jgi:AraC-like DNA-binding protein
MPAHGGGGVQAVQVFSTQGIPGPRKVEIWNSILGGLTDAVHVQPRDPLHFDGTLIRQRLGPMTVFEVRCASVRVSHRLRRAARNTRPSFQVLMPVQGEFTLSHGDRPTLTVGTGSFCLIDLTEPYELIHGDGLRTIGLELPRVLLESCLSNAIDYAGAVVRQDSGASRVLGGLLRSLGSELTGEGSTSALPPMLARSIAGFVAAAFADRLDASLLRGNADRLVAFRDCVDACLGDGDFRPADLARQFNVSERYVRMVFQSAGESMSEYLLRRRLERASQLLCNEFYARRTITNIALECGFNSASHFGQSFRLRFGQTPSQFRAAGLVRRLGSSS